MTKRFFFIFLLGIIIYHTGLARPETLGSASRFAYELAFDASKVIKTICGMIGAGMLTVALLTYREHRNNPEVVSLWKPIGFLIGGAAFLVIAFLPLTFL